MRKVVSAGGLVFDNGRMLVVKHSDGFFGLVKGHVEDGETLEQAAIREVREESGYESEIVRYVGRVTRPSVEDSGERAMKDIEMFLMRITGRADTTPEEEVAWLPVAEALRGKWWPQDLAFLQAHLSTLEDVAFDEDAVAQGQQDERGD